MFEQLEKSIERAVTHSHEENIKRLAKNCVRDNQSDDAQFYVPDLAECLCGSREKVDSLHENEVGMFVHFYNQNR